MKNYKLFLTTMLCLMALSLSAQQLTKGVSKELAEQRKANISNVNYDLTFNVPADVKTPVTGKAVITFDLQKKADVVLDFQGGFSGNCTINNKKKRPATYQKEHIVLPSKFLKQGTNAVVIDFASLDKAMKRHQDYLYTLILPDLARTVFPCFDQPDIKAKFTTTINAPAGWKAIYSDGTGLLPTHLYSFVAGNFQEKTGTQGNRPIRILYRENDPDKVKQLDKILDEFSQSLKWMEGYTAIRPPFKEYDMAILPDYPYGGMEYPGAFQLSDRRVFLGKDASQEDELKRMELIAHETAHLWFGDIVQMNWTEDLWTKEVFANFMSSKITRRKFERTDHEMNFINTYQTRAIAVDRTDGTYPIEQKKELTHGSLLYDNIIYNKATVMMRMLEQTMGATAMQNGMRQFIQEYYFKNATWDDLVNILDKENPAAGVRQFCEVWVKQKGMPVINTIYKDGQIIVSQTDPFGRGLCWRQKFVIQLVHDLKPSRTLVVDMQQPTMTFKVADKPSFIIPNYTGNGYGRFTMDDEYIELLPKRLITTRNDLARYSLLLTIHDNYLMGKVTPSHFGELYRFMMKEKNPLVMKTAIDHMFKIAFDMQPSQRKTLELCMMDLLGENKSSECRQLMYRKMARHATSPDVLSQMERVWQAQTDPMFTDRDYMEMAYRLAITNPTRWKEILSSERNRLQSDYLKQEFDYVSRACNPDAGERDKLFKDLLKKDNRKNERWALHALRLLSADVFEPQNNNLISQSLANLKYLKDTADDQFVGEWMKNLLANHRSPEAKQLVEKFIQDGSKCPEDLKDEVLEAAWILTKQVAYVEKPKPVVSTNKSKAATKRATTKKRK
ncbi:MAG: ERAP1-like C-terminal domain-containing protein [Prevotella sp.]|nr:ERAP1-like C-terminal domain-containing protein [Prevotella sp.]